MRPAAALSLALALTAARLDAGAQPASPAGLPTGAVATGVQGALVLEPGRIRAGELADLEIVVATPPDHALRPVTPPASLPGFWILGAEALPVEKGDGRWIHRVRVRLRARELGQFVWPEQPLEIEAPDGSVQRLLLEGRGLEVVSVQAEFPGRSAPFGLREPALAPSGPGGSRLAAAAAGFAAGLASVGAAALLRRARRRRHAAVSGAAAPAGAGPAPEDRAREDLSAAARQADAAPAAAADLAAAALRRFGSAHFGADLVALTTPEIAARTPGRGAAAHWRALAETLSALDAARFEPGAEGAAPRVRAAVACAEALVTAAAPHARRASAATAAE